MYSLTVFTSIFDNKTDKRINYETFEDFEKSLYDLSKIPGYKAKRGEFIKDKKVSPLISPAIYKPNTTRANVNVIEWASWAALDVDDMIVDLDLEYELEQKFGDWYYVCYSTASSTEYQPKFRLVFPLTENVSAENIRHFWYALNKEFQCAGDEQTKDLSRMYYVPANYPNANNFIFTNKGKEINPTELMSRHPWTAPKKSTSFIDRLPPELQKEVVAHRQSKLQESKKDYSWSTYKDCPFVNKKLISEYRQISRTDGSGRYSMIYKIMTSIACNAVKQQYPISEFEIVDMIQQLDRETSNRYSKRPLKVEASRAIEFAYKNI